MDAAPMLWFGFAETERTLKSDDPTGRGDKEADKETQKMAAAMRLFMH
jgi:hypothetical protein